MVGGKNRVSPGFTIIEITIVLAIISSLVVIALIGQGDIRARARFNDAVDRTVSELSHIENQANTTYNENQSASRGQDSSRVFFANLVDFKGGSSDIDITPLWRPDSSCSQASVCGTTQGTTTTFTIPWAARLSFVGHRYVSFARLRTNGQSVTYIADPSTNEVDRFTLNPYLFSDEDEAKIKLEDGRGNCAEITIKAVTGFIERAYTC